MCLLGVVVNIPFEANLHSVTKSQPSFCDLWVASIFWPYLLNVV